ncbi:MAG: nucleotide exchange factor GrpE [Pseudomonadales bacterium]|nr:nucleotide exchange factor GrpE [Pseudomonadales bacterium]
MTSEGAEKDELDCVEGEVVEDDVSSTEEVSVEVLQVKLADALSKADAAEEKALRVAADLQNARRRAEKDIENAHKFGVDKFVQELLPVIDGLERGLEAVSEEDEALKTAREGMMLTHKLLLDALKKFNVEALFPEGEPFDPNLHEAVSMQPNPDVEPNSVITVFQKGYTLSGRLIRPAMVVVAKG